MHDKAFRVAIVAVVLLLGATAYALIAAPGGSEKQPETASDNVIFSETSVALVGTFDCLPHRQSEGPQTEECAFGIRTDDGAYYAVNFGESAESMARFQARERVEAEGFIVPLEYLSTSYWDKYDIKGIFTVTRFLNEEASPPPLSAKIDITAVCAGALAYMTFPSSSEADVFLADCEKGMHPEVIERYLKEVGVDGAAI